MDKSSIKKFATECRNSLMEDISQRLGYLNVDDISKIPLINDGGNLVEDVSFKSGAKSDQRRKLIDRVKEVGKQHLVEEVAYIWFNRFVALRFMEVNNYLPFGVRVLSSADSSKREPDILSNVLHLDLGLDKEKVYTLQDKNDLEGLYQYVIITLCNNLSSKLPFIFEKISDYSELLFPSHLLYKDSFLDKLVSDIPEKDWQEVEIIGWLYQYYISEKKDVLINAKQKYKSDEIPAVTQLFTSKWIVSYMVDNTLGRYWIDHNGNKELKKNWEFFIDSKDTEYNEKIKNYITDKIDIENLTFCDPAMGSGHILVYAFDLFYQMYSDLGYLEKDIPQLILGKNLFGFEIDERAYQLACFALMMKARKYNKNILNQEIKLNLICLEETNSIVDRIETLKLGLSENELVVLNDFVRLFKDGKTLGSIIKVEGVNLDKVEKVIHKIGSQNNIFTSGVAELLHKVLIQAKLMSKLYDIVVSNPPYMGGKYMNAILNKYVNEKYPDVKSDLFSVFMKMIFGITKPYGLMGFMTPFVWMFIQSFEKLRNEIITNKAIQSMVKPSYTSFFESAIVPICTLVIRNYFVDVKGDYFDLGYLGSAESQPTKLLEAIKNTDIEYRYSAKAVDFNRIPGSPIAYWVSERVREIFEKSKRLDSFADAKQGLATADNNRFRRNWYEVNNKKINLDGYKQGYKWFPYNSGGEAKKYYGNQEYIINWENNGEKIKEFEKSVVRNSNYYFKESISWSKISSSYLTFRYFKPGFIFDVAGCSVFLKEDCGITLNYLSALLNSKVIFNLIKTISPTLNFEVGQISSLPIKSTDSSHFKNIEELTQQNIDISKEEWDSRETSWDFQKNPLLVYQNNLLSTSCEEYCNHWKEKFNQLHTNEEELNRMFLEIYGLQDEMTPDVELKDITLLKDEKEITDGNIVFNQDVIVKQFISYGVGCILGRYSLDTDGLAFAGGTFAMDTYKTFKADEDGIVPVLGDEYFDDDIASRFREFVKTALGEQTLQENLNFIADSLGKKAGETAIQTIRRYFLKDFYNDHIKTYKKRPIYWLFTSGKNKAFNCIVYLHRYSKSTLSKIRIEYLHKYQSALDQELNQVEKTLSGEQDSKVKQKLEKQKSQIIKDMDELRKYDEELRNKAENQIEIDLDDGVKVNYQKFTGLVEPLKF